MNQIALPPLSMYTSRTSRSTVSPLH